MDYRNKIQLQFTELGEISRNKIIKYAAEVLEWHKSKLLYLPWKSHVRMFHIQTNVLKQFAQLWNHERMLVWMKRVFPFGELCN